MSTPPETSDSRHPRRLGVWLGPVLAVPLLVADLQPGHPEVARTAAVAVLMATWWITEALPLSVTALVPVVAFPALGVLGAGDVAATYFNDVIFLFLGGFLVALAMQRWKLHERIALRILLVAGRRPAGLLLGFMAATAFLSMWISNTATTMMMVPIALAVVVQFESASAAGRVRRFAVGIFLGVAYGASLGGLATLVGTPPNLSLARIHAITFPDAPELTFAGWLQFALPLSLTFFAATWGWLSFRHCRGLEGLRFDSGPLRERLHGLGPMTAEERLVLACFVALVVLWLSRSELDLGVVVVPGWSRLLPDPTLVRDGTVSVAVAACLFLLPSKRSESGRLLDGRAIAALPWGIVLLFGGGFALARAFLQSGLSAWLAGQLGGLSAVPTAVLVLATCLLVTFLTELTSNTATTEMLLPVLAGLAVAIGQHPLLLMVPAALSASCAFMLPVATPPNAIVFGTDRVRVKDMARNGLVLNLLGAVLITLAILLFGGWAFGIEPGAAPAWAHHP